MGFVRSAMLARILLALAAPLSAADYSRIDDYLHREMALNGIPGASVAVLHRGQVTYAKGFGVRSTATGEAMTADTPMDLASLSKSFTALAVLELSRQRKIDLDAPAAKYLAELGGAFRRIKLRHLIRHTSGLTRRHDFLVPCCGQPGEFDLDVAVSKLAGGQPSGPPGAAFVYANSNYVLLAAMIQRVSGRPFPAFMRDFVFRPLGMLRTTLDPAEARAWGLAEPHERRWGQSQPSRTPFLGWYGSSLVKSTARDMASYLAAVLKTAAQPRSEPYDLGWFIRPRPEWPGRPRVLEHGGDTWGGNTAAIVAPGWDMGAVVLLNIGVHRAADMARGVLALAAGLPAPRPSKASWTSDTDAWAMVFTACGAVMLAGTSIFAFQAWTAVRRRQRLFRWRSWPAGRAAALLAMSAQLLYLLVHGTRPLPESLRSSLRLLAASTAVVLVLAAVLGFLPQAKADR